MLAFWDMFGEIFGAPMRVARTNTQDEKERSRIEKSLDKSALGTYNITVLLMVIQLDEKEIL